MDMSTNLIIYKDLKNNKIRKNLILWPVQTYRIIAAPTQGLNIFKRSILQLILTGETQVDQISKLLVLDPKFIHYLLNYEMSNLVKKTSRGFQLNNEGKKQLLKLETRIDETNLQEFYFFADAFTGKLIPRIEKAMPIISPDLIQLDKKGHPSIRLTSSKGQGNSLLRPFQVNFPHASIQIPSNQAFNQILTEYNHIIDTLELINDHEMTLSESEARIHLRDISGIKSISTHEPAYLLTAIIDSQNTDTENWTFLDSFHLSFNHEFSSLKEIVTENLADKGQPKAFKDKLDSFFNIKLNNQEKRSFSEEHQLLREKAELWVQDELRGAPKRLIEQMISAQIEYETFLSLSTGRKRHTKNILSEIAISLEIIFKSILWEKDQSSQQLIKQKSNSGKINHNDAQTILKQLETSLFLDTNENFLYFIKNHPKDISRACENNNASFKALVMAALLKAHKTINHPLRKAIKQHPDIIIFCFETYTLRNKTSHDDKQEVKLTLQELKSKIDQLISFAKIITTETKH